MEFVISSKYNIMVITMVRIMIPNTNYLGIDPKETLNDGKIANIYV